MVLIQLMSIEHYFFDGPTLVLLYLRTIVLHLLKDKLRYLRRHIRIAQVEHFPLVGTMVLHIDFSVGQDISR